ncbi:hypothetical protein [Brevundimonas sp.]|uniref:phosphorylase family protein n=1 Tax=Brevundimonas sp. TaxID=1871086 RepID=UPI002D288209|nr:hypothetical protein [Brevundimonas sp.]HYC68854.1 hypothetical protein [Brevundimonas sp.]
MNILVVHDRSEVITEIRKVLSGSDLCLSRIDAAPDYVTARDQLQAYVYDVMILDLTLPHIHGKGAPSHGVVENFLAELFSPTTMNVPGDLIGITRDVGALADISASIGPHLMAIIREDDADGWKTLLLERLTYVEASRQARLRSIYSHFDADVAILVALDKELEPFHEIFELEPIAAGAETYAFTFNDRLDHVRRGVACAIGRPGTASAAASTQSIITLHRPRVALMSGFCGGVEGKANLGDLVFFEQVFDWDAGKWKTDDAKDPHFFPRPEPISIRGSQAHAVARRMRTEGLANAPSRLHRAKELSPKFEGSGEILLEAAGSGSSVVSDVDIRSQISALNETIAAVDMESYGFYHACQHTLVKRPEMLCVKAVADFCDMNKQNKVHAACCYLAAQVTSDIILHKWTF